MKRIGNLLAVVILVVGVFLPMNYSRAASIDVLLLPYQNIIDQVNQELGSSIYIPDGNKEKAYNGIKDLSPSEFEARIRKEYLDTLVPSVEEQEPRSSVKRDAVANGDSGVVPLPNASGKANVVPLG